MAREANSVREANAALQVSTAFMATSQVGGLRLERPRGLVALGNVDRLGSPVNRVPRRRAKDAIPANPETAPGSQ